MEAEGLLTISFAARLARTSRTLFVKKVEPYLDVQRASDGRKLYRRAEIERVLLRGVVRLPDPLKKTAKRPVKPVAVPRSPPNGGTAADVPWAAVLARFEAGDDAVRVIVETGLAAPVVEMMWRRYADLKGGFVLAGAELAAVQALPWRGGPAQIVSARQLVEALQDGRPLARCGQCGRGHASVCGSCMATEVSDATAAASAKRRRLKRRKPARRKPVRGRAVEAPAAAAGLASAVAVGPGPTAGPSPDADEAALSQMLQTVLRDTLGLPSPPAGML